MKGQYLSPPVDDRSLWDAWLSYHNLPTMLAADEVGLFDALVDEPLAVAALAGRCNVNPHALAIVNSLLCALGLLVRRDGRYGLTPVSRHYLVKSSDFYWGALLAGFRQAAPSTELIVAALAPDAQHQGGENAKGWEAGEIPAERARHIAAFMHAHSCAAAVGAAQHPVFEQVERLLDIGGGSGVFPIAMAQRWPHLRGTIMDLDTMCEAAMHYVREGGVAGRVDAMAVDMFRQPWPTGYDALFFSNVFHDWNDETCLLLARKAFEALPSGGRILLHEALVNDNLDGPATVASFSILMLYGTQGQQRALPELTALLREAGFVDCEAHATCGYYSLTIARKP